ncbi:acetyl-CoA carboxylase biotin carboxylase subunit [Alphaproteobacteria bacterium]|nr:acetyl-CoA carboxylase biotin carboxylase subunit [Alphaproteobacteria bacterium]
MFDKVLIANRGEIALRIHRACKEMGIDTVAVHSTADIDSMSVRLADEAVCIGPPAGGVSYLHMPSIISAADITGAQAVHPGVGFLSENADFAEMVETHGLTFIGPSVEHLRNMGNKVTAKKIAVEIGLPVVPGSAGEVKSLKEAKEVAKSTGYPVLIKATAGGGGRGMKIANSEDELENALSMASTEAKAAFGNAGVYMEKYLGNPRHIEIQVIADKHGNAVHLGERDCSMQRRHQKVIEEAPSPALSAKERQEIGELTRQAVARLGYYSVGTVEYLYENGEFFFIEMNTRLQVEHPITEMITGVDLVREQIRIAHGHKLSFSQEDIRFSGHSIECRINAEHPETFVPSPGKLQEYHAPGGLGIRVDSHLYSGYSVPPHYDSLISKLIVHGKTRNECLMRLRRALDEYVIGGIHTSIPLHQHLVHEPDFINGDYSIKWLEKHMEENQN